MLGMLGVEPTTERIYRTMVDNPDWGVEALSAHLGIGETQIRVALDELFALTLVRNSVQEPHRLRAVPMQIGLQSLLARQQAEIARQHEQLARSHAALNAMLTEHHDAAPDLSGTAEIERLTGLDEIYDRLESLAMNTRSECLSVMPGGAQSAASLAASKPLDAAALARGVEIRTLYQDSVRNDTATMAYARFLTDHGGEVRTLPITPPRMLIIDRRCAILAADPASSRAGAFVLSSASVIASLLVLFDQAWETATPLGADHTPDAGNLTPMQRELLRLLAQGLTDEAAATRLGVSARSTRRMMAELIERLNARSRFEAGIKATQRGWV